MNAMRTVIVIGAVALVLLLICVIAAGAQRAAEAYLAAFMLWVGLPLGAMGMLMIHHLTGGRWGAAMRPMLESAALTTPLSIPLVIPVLLGVKLLYPWAHDDAHATHAQAWLNVPFFVVRSLAYVLMWSAMAVMLVRWSRRADAEPDQHDRHRLRCTRLSAAGLIVYVLTASFAVIDWGMSLDEHWYSTIYGVLFVTNHGLLAVAISIVTVSLPLSPREWAGVRAPTDEAAPFPPDILHDLGNWLLTFVLFWAYVSFSQYLIIWSGNIPEEVKWYVPRTQGAWGAAATALIVLHFAVPFVLLLNRPIKRRGRALAAVAALVLVMQVVNVWWMLVPSLPRSTAMLHWLDPVAVAGVGGLWVGAYLWMFARVPRPTVNIAEGEVAHG